MFAIGEMLGGVVSCTVTVKLPVAVLLRESTAEQFTVVVPNEKVEPDGGPHVTVTEPSTRSEAEAEYETAAPVGPVASTVISAGRDNEGGVVSCTVTVKFPERELPASSVAVQLTVVIPSEKVLPDGGVQTGVTDGSTESVDVAVKLATAPEGPVASMVMFAGSVNVGCVPSR